MEQVAWASVYPDRAEDRVLAGKPFDHLVNGHVIVSAHAA